MTPTATTSPRPRIKRIDKTLASFLDPGPAGDLVRLDGQRWRQVVVAALEVATSPAASPANVKQAIDELLRLATVADAIVQEIFTD